MSDRCSNCTHFEDDPAFVEASFPGLRSLSSAYSSVAAGAGLCLRFGLFVAPWKGCGGFETKGFGAGRSER
jgi:hypothetical protein